MQDGDVLKGLLTEQKENGIVKENGMLTPQYMKDAEQAKLFAGAKVGDVITFNPTKAYGSEVEVSSMLGITKEEAKELTSDFTFELQAITRHQAAAIDGELFAKVYGENNIADEADFRAHIKAEIEQNMAEDAKYKFGLDAKAAVMKKMAKVEFPEAFLKRWVKATNEKMTDEELEKDFPAMVDELRWHLAKDQLAKHFNVQVEKEDVEAYAKEVARMQFMQYLETTTDTVSVEVGDEMKEVKEAPEESPIPVSAEEPERVEEALESIEEVVAEEEKEETIVTPATDEETISEEVVEEVEAEVTNVEMEEPKLEETPSVAPKKKGNSTLWIVLLALLLLIAFGLYWIFRSPSQEETQPTPAKVESIVEETPAIVEEPDSSSTHTIEEPAPAISASNEKVATIADTTEYKIVGNKTSYTVQSGETLTKIALKFYGSKNYWPYIAIHNKGTLKNTNQLSVGVKLEIPELKPINE